MRLLISQMNIDAKFYSKEEIKELDKLGKLSSITKQVLSDNNWL